MSVDIHMNQTDRHLLSVFGRDCPPGCRGLRCLTCTWDDHCPHHRAAGTRTPPSDCWQDCSYRSQHSGHFGYSHTHAASGLDSAWDSAEIRRGVSENIVRTCEKSEMDDDNRSGSCACSVFVSKNAWVIFLYIYSLELCLIITF